MRSLFLHDPIICSFYTQEAQEIFPCEHKKNRSYLTGHLEGQPLQDTHKQPRSGGDWEELLILAWLSYFFRLFPRQLERGFLELFIRMPGGQPEFSVPKVIHFSSLCQSNNTICCPHRAAHILNTCHMLATVLGAGEEGADSEKKCSNSYEEEDKTDNKFVRACIHNRSNLTL